MHRVTAEIAEEVSVLLQYGDFDAGASQQIAQHDAGGASANNATDCLGFLVRHRSTPSYSTTDWQEPERIQPKSEIIATARRIHPPIPGCDYDRLPSSCRVPCAPTAVQRLTRRHPARHTRCGS